MVRGPRGPRWNITVNCECAEFDPPRVAAKDGIDYACWGFELAPTTGQPHWHMYIRFDKRLDMNGVKKFINVNEAHLEMCKGNEEQNRDYCWKADAGGQHSIRGELGEFVPDAGTQGKRTDIEKLKEEIKKGISMYDIADQYPDVFIRYPAGIRSLKNALTVHRLDRKVQTIWLWGPSSCGKTYRVEHIPEFPLDARFKVVPQRGKWDSYNGQKMIYFEEFSGVQDWTINEMKMLLDSSPFELNARYVCVKANYEIVYILTNDSPMEYYKWASKPNLDAFRRRITCRFVGLSEPQGGPTLDEIMKQPANPW